MENRFGTRWGGFLMPFLRNGGETVQDTIELIVTAVVTASKIALYVMAAIALVKYITA